MHPTEHSILKYMKDKIDKEYSTSEIVESVFSDDLRKIEDTLHKDFKTSIDVRKAKLLKGKLHRNLLYHLNKLIEDDLISLTKQGNKGKKYFKINLEYGEEITIRRKHSRITISKPMIPAMPIEGFEHRGIIYKFDPKTWVTRLNSVLLRICPGQGVDELKKVIYKISSDFSDGLGLNNFEIIIESSVSSSGMDSLLSFINEMKNSCEDFGRKITIIIDVKNISNERPIIEFFKEFVKMKQDEVIAIFDTTLREFHKRADFFEKLIKCFSESESALYIKNKGIHQAPYVIGRAGPYTFSEDDWKYMSKKSMKNSCFSLASASIAVDVKKFFETGLKIQQFRKLMRNILMALFLASSSQRTRTSEYFKNILDVSGPNLKEIFKGNRSYIRFWNYGWKQENLDYSFVLDLISNAKKEVDEFCMSETTIFKACGMPVDFKIAFSCAFSDFDEGMSKEVFSRIKIGGIEDLIKGNIRERLIEKEQIAKIFDGGDRIRLIRAGELNPLLILKEIELILSVYSLPLFCYDFGSGRVKNHKLSSFFEDS